jgi:hypothetical protein
MQAFSSLPGYLIHRVENASEETNSGFLLSIPDGRVHAIRARARRRGRHAAAASS